MQLTRWLGICAAISVLTLPPVFAQGTGTIKGTVRDKSSNEELPGANVMVKGSTLGAVTNTDGAYVIRNVPRGVQTLVVSYVGYVTVNEEFFIPPEGGTIVRDIALAPTDIQGKEVVITAQAQGQLQAINQQLASDKIVSVVSEAKIQELPDFNAAQAISRLPGVSALQSSGEANKIVIRGAAPQYNAVAISGITLSSTGSTELGVTGNTDITSKSVKEDRSVDLTMVTPYMIKTISVYKSLTPDMDANAIGGVVDMELREAPGGFHTDLLFQSGYVQKSKTYGNYRFVASGSNRFLDDKLGVYLLANVERYDRNSDNMTGLYGLRSNVVDTNTGYVPVFVRNVTLNRHIETRQRYGGNFVFDFRLPSGSLRSVNMLSRLNSDYKDYKTVIDYQNHNLDYNYRSGKKNTDLAINTLEGDFDLDLLAASFKFANNYSRNHDPDSPFFTFRESGGTVGNTPDNTVPEDLTNLINHVGPSSVYLNTINLINADYKESAQVYKGDIKVPFNFVSFFSGTLKFGGQYRYTSRQNDQNAPFARIDGSSTIQREMVDSIETNFPLNADSAAGRRFPGSDFTSADQDLMQSFLDDQFGGMQWIPEAGVLLPVLDYVPGVPSLNWNNSSGVNAGGWFDGEYQSVANDFKYIEKYYAAYIMSELSFGSDFRIIGGARFEQERSLFEAYNSKEGRDPGAQITIPITTYPENHYWLPMVQAKYTATDWMDVRYAYTQSLARPDYHQLSPHFSMDYSRNNVWSGNPSLTPAHAYSHDLMLSFHTNDLGLLTIGAFYKTIANFTYYTQYRLYQTAPPGLDSVGTYTIGGVSPLVGATVYTYVNSPYDAHIKGIEADFQTRFWYLPAPLDGIVIGLNYTHIWSEATYPWRDSRTYLNPTPPPRFLTTVVDSTRPGRLINQPDDLFNAYIGYDFKGFSGRVSFLFQGNSVSSIGNFVEQDGFTRDYFRIDASARQMLPIDGLQIFLDLNNINARKNSSAQISIGGFTSEDHYGLVANLGVRYIL